MSAQRQGIEGRWAQVIEERDALRQKVARLEEDHHSLVSQLAEFQTEKALKISTVRHLLHEALSSGEPDEKVGRLEELFSESIREAHERAEKAERRTSLRLDEEEQEAWDALQAYMRIVTHRWKLRVNQSELSSAVHVLQAAVQQHMLHRLAPKEWGSWWQKPEGKES